MESPAALLFNYLRDVIYDPVHASLDPAELPEEFVDLGKGLMYFIHLVNEATTMAKELAKGNLHGSMPSPGNEIAAPLMMLHSSLSHLTWQTQQVAKGDYQQRVEFMGDFSFAFNNMVNQLKQRHQNTLDEKSRLEMYVNLMLTNCPDPVLLFNRQGLLLYAGDAYLQSCNIEKQDEIKGKSLHDLFAPVVSEAFMNEMTGLLDDAYKTVQTLKAEQSIDFKQNGRLRHYSMQFSPMIDQYGDVGGVLILLHDDTEIEQARRDAEQSSHAKSIFLANMGHEMRTPLNAVMGMTSIGKTAANAEKKDYCFSHIADASKHLLGVIGDILDMANIESNTFELKKAEFDCSKLLQQAADIVIYSADDKNQKLTVHVDENIPTRAMGDERRLIQVLINLLSNAIKFTPEKGNIKAEARLLNDEDGVYTLSFAISDTGIGISAEQQARIFLSFQQAESAFSRSYGGAGLGLAISRYIVRMMDGDIDVVSELRKGSTFTVTVKLKHPAFWAGADINEEEPLVIEGIFKGKRLLLVEDIPINNEITVSLLEPTKIEIETAENGAEALRMYCGSPNRFDLIMMDIQMPIMDGYEATRQIRKSGMPGCENIPIIAVTANVLSEDIKRCMSAGMNNHIGKPLDYAELMNKLRFYLQ